MSATGNGSNIGTIDESKTYDVCIIGSGPAGLTLAKSLVEKEIDTMVLESGTNMIQWLFDNRVRKLAAYDFSGNTNYPLSKTKSRLSGGNSNFWTGRCQRFDPSDFEIHPYTPATNHWPISYKDINAYYEKAEKLLRVRGGTPSKYAPLRDAPLPIAPKIDISFLKFFLGKAGLTIDDTPTATPKKSLRFFRFQKEILPSILDSKYLKIINGATVTNLIANSSKHIVGAEVRSLNFEKKVVRARIFVVSCGGIETPRLLLLSRSENFPKGIGNSNDMVGRCFNEHPAVNFYGRIPHSWDTIKPTNKVGRTHQLYGKFRTEGLGSIVPVFRQGWILPHHISPLRLSNIPRNLMSVMSRFTKATLYIGVLIEQEIVESNRVMLSKNRKDRFGNPLAHLVYSFSEKDFKLLDRCRELVRGIYDRLDATNIYEAEVTFSRHHQGTCRMGNNPNTSVIDRNLRVHESPNLYLCGSEAFVTSSAMAPALTIVALAHRLGDHLVARFKEGSVKSF